MQVGGHLQATTATLVKVLTEVPPPGRITLADIDPSLVGFQGNADADFVAHATNVDGKPIEFVYVRLGAPSYDDFFRQTQLVYAICYQLVETESRLVHLSGELLHAKIDADANLSVNVSKALQLKASAGVNLQLIAQLNRISEAPIHRR